ncbi:MAG: alpha/beta hydrolase [Microthrixaceae bacterium]
MSTIPSTDVADNTNEAEVPEDRFVDANGITIAFNTFGDPANPAVLLVMGLGTQMIAWSDQMCRELADDGYFVVRYDNRDVGLSTHFDSPTPKLTDLIRGQGNVYKLDDMAADGMALLSELGIRSAHVMGASMGGFIAQTMAIAEPNRVDSLSLIMTSTGSRRVGRPTPRVMYRMARRPVTTTREEAMREAVLSYEIIGSPGITDLDGVADLAGRAFDKAHDPAGTQRQLAAIMAQPDRTPALKKLRMPTFVMHGLRDPLVAASGGLALARSIPRARFVGLHGMGHDLPRTAAAEIRSELLGVIRRSEIATA